MIKTIAAATLTSLSVLLLSGAAPGMAQQIKGFATDLIEIYDQDENYLGDLDVSGLKASDFAVRANKGGMLQVQSGEKLYWVYESDVTFDTKPMEDCRTMARAAASQTAATMGLGCQ